MFEKIIASIKPVLALLLAAVLIGAGSALAAGKVGEMAADFSGLKDFNGKSYNLRDFHGKVVLLFAVQYNCGGCKANAPRIGQIAKHFQGRNFQALGADINTATAPELHTFDKVLRGTDSTIDFPLLSGLTKPNDIKDSIKNGGLVGTMWIPYDALRDVYFVIDHTGKIVYRLDGNRGNAVDSNKYISLTNAVASAIANIPTVSISSGSAGAGMCLQACKVNGRFQFGLTATGAHLGDNVDLRILNSQGRLIRSLEWNANSEATKARQASWDGKDAKGNVVAWGNYFLSATAPGQSVSLMVYWLP